MRTITAHKKLLAMLTASTLAIAMNPVGIAYAADQSKPVAEQSISDARPMNLSPKYSAFLTNGKGGAYRSYNSYPYDGTVIYKARISGGTLILSGKYETTGGTLTKPAKKYSVKGKKFESSAPLVDRASTLSPIS